MKTMQGSELTWLLITTIFIGFLIGFGVGHGVFHDSVAEPQNSALTNSPTAIRWMTNSVRETNSIKIPNSITFVFNRTNWFNKTNFVTKTNYSTGCLRCDALRMPQIQTNKPTIKQK